MKKSLYIMPVQIQLMVCDDGADVMNLPLNDNDWKLIKNVYNEIEFYIRDHDRKSYNLVGKKVKIIISDMNTKNAIIEKYAKIIDEYKGRIKFIFDAYDLTDIISSDYVYAVFLIDEYENQKPTYTDRNANTIGYVEIIDGGMPNIKESIEINNFFFKITDTFKGELRRTSSSIPGSAQVGNKTGLITFQVYPVNFTGRIWLQGTLEPEPSDYSETWFDIPIGLQNDYHYMKNCSSTQGFNIQGMYSFIRFQWQREVEVSRSTNSTSQEIEDDLTNNIIKKILVKTS